VKELNAKFFDHAIIERYLHAAISTPSAGVEFDYERLELLGEILSIFFILIEINVFKMFNVQATLF
jgi:hypothetical protein